MAFWIIMVLVNLLLPLLLIIFGNLFLFKPPKKINSLYGYRTELSMKNQETWYFAHHYCGKLWTISGLLLIPVVVIIMSSSVHQEENTLAVISAVSCVAQSLLLVGTVIATELKLQSVFDQNGNRKN